MVVSSISEGASLTLHFLTCGYYGWKEAFGLSFAPPLFINIEPQNNFISTFSQYVSASGLCRETCGHQCVLLHCRPPITLPGSFPPSRSSWCGVRVPQVPHITSQLRPPAQPIASMLLADPLWMQQDEKEKHLARFDTRTKDGARRAGLAGAEGVGGGGHREGRALFILSHDICLAPR
ncbi:hypothetical protein F7725_021637 [Dissostichus mawsoni]|uniref:Uncharacterized protein n=1 Tax=Dissostichus mawsoni TaxID=36200 RepID=A0A7J5ZFV5_DISMA|nr:hypothetical protein F7725_021637 [Dissostichus mawsoni]